MTPGRPMFGTCASWRARREAIGSDSVGTVMQGAFTPLQGQYLAFIRAYATINRRPPAEADLQRFFDVTAPTVHQMVLALEGRGFITRIPGQPRSIRVLLPLANLPTLQER